MPARPWTFHNACISLSDALNGQCIGAGQLVQQSWDTITYLASKPGTPTGNQPQPTAASECITAGSGTTGRSLTGNALSSSCQPRGAALLWTVRRVVTADEREGRARPTRQASQSTEAKQSSKAA